MPALLQAPRVPLLMLAIGWLGGAPIGAAQTPADRAALERLRTHLDSASGVASIEAIARAEPRRRGLLANLADGFIRLRRAELSGDPTGFYRAILDFDQAASRARHWPYPWFGLALAKLAASRRDLLVKPSPHQLMGLSYFDGYVEDLDRSLTLDSTLVPAMRILVGTMADQGERDQPQALTAWLPRAERLLTDDPTPYLVEGRYQRRSERNVSSELALRTYLLHGGDRGIGQLELARTLAALGQPSDAVAAYRAGLEDPSPAGREAYRADLSWIATAAELSGFDAASRDSLPALVDRFWDWRDAGSLRRSGETLAEHLRRWVYVHRHFRVVHPERRTMYASVHSIMTGPCHRPDPLVLDDSLPDSLLRPADGRRRERLLDDRAYVYMRHGAPVRRVRGPGGPEGEAELQAPDPSGGENYLASAVDPPSDALLPAILAGKRREEARANESWLYWFAGRIRIFDFVGSPALGLGAPTTLTVEPVPDIGWLASRAMLDGRYLELEQRLLFPSHIVPFQCTPLLQELAAENRENAATGLTTDSYTLVYPHELNPVVQIFGVGRPTAGSARVLVVYALSATALRPADSLPGQSGVRYPIEVRMAALDPARRIARRRERVRQFVHAGPLASDTHLVGYEELAVPPGRYDVRVALAESTATVGGVVGRDSLALPGGDSLYLSDVVLGREGAGLVWVDQGERIPLNPLDAWYGDQSAELFYETDGLVPGRVYHTTIAIDPVTGKGHGVRLQFDATATATHQRVRRSLGLASLGRGQYRLTVTLSEAGRDGSVSRERLITVLGPTAPGGPAPDH